jgi:hypothetical protein
MQGISLQLQGERHDRRACYDRHPCAFAGPTRPMHVFTLQCVVSACPQATTLVTVIDLDKDWSATCYCP